MPEYPWIIYRMSEGPLTTKEVHQGVNEQLNRKLGTDWGYSEYEWANLLQGFRPLPIRTASGTIAHFSDGADDVPCVSVVANIVPIQEGTGTPSPSNPRPISGTDELTLTKTGANLLDGEKTADAFVETVSTPTNTYKGEDTDGKFLSFFGSYAINQKNFFSIPFKANTQYSVILKMKKDNASNASNLAFVYTDGTRVQLTAPTTPTPNEVFTFVATSSSTKNLARIEGFYASGRSFLYYEESGVFEGVLTTADFEPYTGTTYTVNLGQTVYGGSAEVVGGVGEEKWGMKKASDLTFTHYDVAQGSLFRSQVITDCVNEMNLTRMLCSEYKTVYPTSRTDNTISCTLAKQFDIIDNRFTTVEDFLENVDCTIVYPLATPTDFTFTGQPINSYLGVNNVWTDSGEMLDVEYRSNF